MDQRLSSDHPVQQFSARIPDRLDDLPIRIGSSILECEHGQRREHRIEPRPANTGLSGRHGLLALRAVCVCPLIALQARLVTSWGTP